MSEQWSFPWEQAAMRGEAMPDGLCLADQMAFTTLRNIYWSYREKRMGREQAAAEKKVLRREWEKAVETAAFDRKLTDYHVRQIKAQEHAVCVCRKDPTPENALRLCDVIDGLARPAMGEWEAKDGL